MVPGDGPAGVTGREGADLMLELYCRTVSAVRDDDGQGLVEYALIILFVAVALVGALGVLAGSLDEAYKQIAAKLAEL